LSPVFVNIVVPDFGGGASGPAWIGVHGQSPIASSRTQCRAGNQARSIRIEVSCRVRVSFHRVIAHGRALPVAQRLEDRERVVEVLQRLAVELGHHRTARDAGDAQHVAGIRNEYA
jgi:hypothetical protein